jgi:hypothetical protein
MRQIFGVLDNLIMYTVLVGVENLLRKILPIASYKFLISFLSPDFD